MDQGKFIVELEPMVDVEMLKSWEVHSFKVDYASGTNGLTLVMRINYHILHEHTGKEFLQRVNNSLISRKINVKFVQPDGSMTHEHAYLVLGRGEYIPAVEGHYDSVKNVVQQLVFRVMLVDHP